MEYFLFLHRCLCRRAVRGDPDPVLRRGLVLLEADVGEALASSLTSEAAACAGAAFVRSFGAARVAAGSLFKASRLGRSDGRSLSTAPYRKIAAFLACPGLRALWAL